MTISRPLLAAAAVLLAASAPLLAQAQTKWDLPAAYPASNFHTENLVQFAGDVDKASGGKLKITVHANAALFKADQIKRAVQGGQAQIGEILLTAYSNEWPIYAADGLPFLADSYDEAAKLYKVQKPLLEKKLADQGMLLLYAVAWPPQGIYAKKPINSAADLKGVKWRAYRSSGSTGYDTKTYEHLKVWVDTQAWLPKNAVLVNKAAFDALDKPTQAAVLKAGADAEARGWASSKAKNSEYIELLKKNGMTIQPPTAQLKADMKKVGDTMLKEWLDKAGPEGKALVDAFNK